MNFQLQYFEDFFFVEDEHEKELSLKKLNEDIKARTIEKMRE